MSQNRNKKKLRKPGRPAREPGLGMPTQVQAQEATPETDLKSTARKTWPSVMADRLLAYIEKRRAAKA